VKKKVGVKFQTCLFAGFLFDYLGKSKKKGFRRPEKGGVLLDNEVLVYSRTGLQQVYEKQTAYNTD